jgi:hypothetical protein
MIAAKVAVKSTELTHDCSEGCSEVNRVGNSTIGHECQWLDERN